MTIPRTSRRRAVSAFAALALAATSTVGLAIPAADAAIKQSCRTSSVDLLGASGDDNFLIAEQTARIGAADGFFVVELGDGNDTIDFTPGALEAFGTTTRVCISGGNGNDKLNGTDGKDKLSGGPGNDVLIGFAGRDVLDGGPGKDDLFGGKGRDKLLGGQGADFIYGAQGNDVIKPGGGNDTSITGGGINKVVNKAGTDLIIAEPFTIDGADGPIRFPGTNKSSTIVGGKGNDFIFGGSAGDKITDKAGTNWILGRGGDDTITGGIGNDTIFGGEANDKIDCGDGTADWAGGGTSSYTPTSRSGEIIAVAAPQANDQVGTSCEVIFAEAVNINLTTIGKTSTSADVLPGVSLHDSEQLPELSPSQLLMRSGSDFRVADVAQQPDSRS